MQKLNGNIFLKTLPGAGSVTLNSGELKDIWNAGRQQHPFKGRWCRLPSQAQVLGLTASGSNLDSAPHWLCDLTPMTDLSGLPFL